MKIKSYLAKCKTSVKAELEKYCRVAKPSILQKAMQYAVLNGGKRLRAAFVYATGQALGAQSAILNSVAASVEMIHAYSLVHDDLPALDNDDLRRGKPTCHKKFDEATAILAGDALQTFAFELLSKKMRPLAADVQLQMIHRLAQAIGANGMIGGEQLDLAMVNQKPSVKKLEEMYQLKTACLITTSIVLGALAANCQDKKIISQLEKFGDALGVAFQIHDDIIGIESDTKTLGKKQGADLAMNKPVYPVIVGKEKAKRRVEMLYNNALDHLGKTKMDTRKLQAIAAFVVARKF